MKSLLAIKQNDANMNIVITTGCPQSGWETTLPTLRQLGLNDVGDDFGNWYDELDEESDIKDIRTTNRFVQPTSRLIEKAMSLNMDETTENALLWADSRNLWLLEFWATTFPQARFLLFYTRAEYALANALQEGEDPEQFIEAWNVANRQLMQFQRRNRNRSLLLDTEAAAKQPEALVEACRRIGIVLGSTKLSPNLLTTIPALEYLLANQFLDGQPSIQTLEMELEASAQPLGSIISNEIPTLIDVFQSYKQWQARIERLTEEKDRQAGLVVDHQGQILQLTKVRDEQVKLASERLVQLTQVQEAHEKERLVRKEIEQENELLLLQLHQVQEELESVFLQKQQAEKIHNEQDTHQKQLQQELNDTKNRLQTEEKLRKGLDDEKQKHQNRIAQLTHARDEQIKLVEDHQSQIQQLTKSRNEQTTLLADYQTKFIQLKQANDKLNTTNNETEQENELLLLQLHQLQEELEHYFLKYQDLVQQTEEETKLDPSDSEVQHETKKTSQNKPEKVATPIRVLKKPFKRTSKAQKRERDQVQLIKDSGLFDEAWYLAEYPDVAEAGVDAVAHYLRYGAAEERNPSTRFDTAYYLVNNPDIVLEKTNPLVHYIRFGREEGRLPMSQAISR